MLTPTDDVSVTSLRRHDDACTAWNLRHERHVVTSSSSSQPFVVVARRRHDDDDVIGHVTAVKQGTVREACNDVSHVTSVCLCPSV